jgi:tetratricopeptide (TPR) repeat protein
MVCSVRSRALTALVPLLLASASGCAHRVGASAPVSEAARRLGAEAVALRTVTCEEDFADARQLYRALHPSAPERYLLRRQLLRYLLAPLATIDAEEFKRRGSDLGANDDLDRILASFRDALELYGPDDLWGKGSPRIDAEEKPLLRRAADLVASLFASRGSEAEVATALLVLQTLEPNDRAFRARLNELLPWLETGSQLALSGNGLRNLPTVTDVLESAATVWPAPAVVDRLAATYIQRQERLATLLRRPLGSVPSRGAIGEMLLEGETVQTTAISVASLYLRAGQVDRAASALVKVSGRPGDDPELRQLVSNVARSRASRGDYLALARRFLPRMKPLGGTSNDRVDVVAARELLMMAADRWPEDAEVRILLSRVSAIMGDLYLSLRLLEESQPLLEKSRANKEEQASVAAEMLDRSFEKLRQRMVDNEHLEPAAREAEVLRRRFAENRQRFGDDRLNARVTDIDYELARGLLNAGLVDRAESLLVSASKGEEPRAEIALELAKLATKRGDVHRASQILEGALEQQRGSGTGQETISFVETQAKLAYALGNAHEVAGQVEPARQAWRTALRGWERLMAEYLRRKEGNLSAEATMEVGRLTYLLGRREEGVAKFLDAIEQNEARDQSYIDALAFLVQHGDVDAALDVYRRTLSRPSRVVSEYVKVYASLWMVDLLRRAGRSPEPSAETFLRTLASRRAHLRPQRVVAWYVQLARYTLGLISYDQLLGQANTAGKKAELYFYEAMRRLADGRSDDAHALWNKVLETRMFEFLEYDMASRYLRTGAPTRAVAEGTESETI